jgi:uncharacterized protein with PQ loop repeat
MLVLILFVVYLTTIMFLPETQPIATIKEEKEERFYFNIFNVVAVIAAVYLLAYRFVQNLLQGRY